MPRARPRAPSNRRCATPSADPGLPSQGTPPLDPAIDDDRFRPIQADAYYNLHRHCWSIVTREGAERGRVVAYVPRAVLADATLVVREGGWHQVLRERRKNVHAFVHGRLLPPETETPDGVRPISYNPYEAGHFTLRDDDVHPPVPHAALVVLDGCRAMALEPRP